MLNSTAQLRLAGILAAASLSIPCPQAVAADPSVDEMIEALATKPGESKEFALTRGVKRPAAVPAKREGRLQLSVQFDYASATISPGSRELLLRLAAAMKSPALEGQRYRIEGHTDSTGSATANLLLSRKRALAVSQFLKSASGIEAGRLSAWGMGSSTPANASDPTAAENRRVVIVSMEALPAGADDDEGAGSVLQLNGSLSVRRRDASVPLQAGARIREGDVLSTPAGASVIVRLDDGTSVLLRAGTDLKIARLKLQGELGKLSQAFELLVGAVRYVSGALGKGRPEAIAFLTGSATVGIRGTDFDIVYTTQPMGAQDSGTYVRVNRGSVAVGGLDGSVVQLAKDEQAYAGMPKPVTRGGTKAPAATRINEAPGIFRTGELDELLESR
jgi:outer membrane protein OmpA-like peptidoglycan-associated protein